MSGVLDHIDIASDAMIRQAVASGPGWRDLGLRAWQRSIALAPVSHVEQEAGQYGPQEVGGSLRDSMEIRFIFGVDPRIEIGSKHTVGDDDLALLALVELGTEPHLIPPKEGGVLAFVAGGHKVITPKPVHHPGTKKNPFVERAMQQVIHEALGVTLVAL